MIEFINLKKSFSGREVLRGISFKIEKGEIVFILGTSGTGKSVLLKNLVGLLQPDSGEIYIDGDRVDQKTEEEYLPVRKKCGMVFQHPALFDSLTIFENIAFGLRKHFDLEEAEITRRVEKALHLVHLKDVDKKMPQDISYGMQKRVSLARTLAIQPEVLLFDEPTTGLDPVTTNAINKLIFDLSRELKVTSVVVSHDMHCAMDIADRIIVLDKGQVVAEGTAEQMMQSEHPLVKDFLEEVERGH
ncbi:MAG: ABC transporter ATP-binding protein [Bdellovibrionaceae bacterium]|nr:ABC transporter ATP-binding protein [Pseudobdellovibrionaceae bacterium]